MTIEIRKLNQSKPFVGAQLLQLHDQWVVISSSLYVVWSVVFCSVTGL